MTEFSHFSLLHRAVAQIYDRITYVWILLGEKILISKVHEEGEAGHGHEDEVVDGGGGHSDGEEAASEADLADKQFQILVDLIDRVEIVITFSI